MPRPHRLLPTLAALLLPGLAGAQPATRPGLAPTEARQTVDIAIPPWSSLVRVQTEAGGRCTGVLIAPDRVLTAAHCLLAPATGLVVLPSRTHVLSGYERGEFREHVRGAAFTLGPAYVPAARGPIGADWAVIRLATPLRDPFLPLAPLPAAGTQAMLGGWQRDRAHVLLADTACRIEAPLRDAEGRLLLRHGCAATKGSSGGPLLVRQGEGWAVAGVASVANLEARGGVAVAVAGLPLLP